MKNKVTHPKVFVITFSLLLIHFSSISYAHVDPGFNITVLGAKGGIQDGNLTSFMIKPTGDNRAITCDAGSIVNGLNVAEQKGAFDDITWPIKNRLKYESLKADKADSKVGYILKQHIKGYLISHAHLDHVLGMLIASPDDSAKPIYALASTLEELKQTHFNWQSWPNFANDGVAPLLKKYDYVALRPSVKQNIRDTDMAVSAFPLSHTSESTAFLIEHINSKQPAAVLCFGDTEADSVSKKGLLSTIWKATAALVKAGTLKAIIIESSYTNDRADSLLFGHLTPKYILQELSKFEQLAGGKGSLTGLPVIISHIKSSLLHQGKTEQKILQQLNAGNSMNVKFIIPEQGDSWTFN